MKDTRILAVDALRALAVTPVILFHLSPGWMPGGYLGVDVFFVISGYLITGIIIEQLAAGDFSFQQFYMRRIRRILPALFAVLAFVSAIWFCQEPLLFEDLARLVRGVLLLKANHDIKNMVGDYWAVGAQSQPLLHTWSLAVEEQFYLLFPLLVWGYFKLLPGRPITVMLAVVCLVSMSAFLFLNTIKPDFAFYSALTRGWELLIGSIIATLRCRENFKADNVKPSGTIGALSLLVIAAAYFLPFVVNTPRSLGPVLAVAGTAWFLFGMRGSVSAYPWLCRPSLVFIGVISYSLYLWHWPVIVFFGLIFRQAAISPAILASQAALIFVLSWASFRWIEVPARRWPATPFVMFIAAILIYAGVNIAVSVQQNRWTRLYGEGGLRSSSTLPSGVADVNVGGFRGMTMRGGPFVDGSVSATTYGKKYAAIKIVEGRGYRYEETVSGAREDSQAEILCWGDSHAMVLAPVIDATAKMNGFRTAFHIRDGAAPLVVGHATSSDREAKGLALLRRKPAACIFVMRYDSRRYEDYEESFNEILKHTKLAVVQQPPVLAIPDVCTVNYFAFLRDERGVRLEKHVVRDGGGQARLAFERKLLAKFGNNPRFTLIRTDDLFLFEDGSVRWWDRINKLNYIDDDHLSEYGCELIAPKLAKYISSP